MNSTSSISPAKAPPNKAGLQPWQFFLTASFLAAAAAVWLTPPATPVALLFISLAVAAAGACAAALHVLLRAVSGQAHEIQVTESLRAALEREKLLALRAIKDLQFDVAMGKVSPADAAPMEARLRERAAAIMRELDGREAIRRRVEHDLAARSGQAQKSQGAACAACATVNDIDAKFCKGCGAKL